MMLRFWQQLEGLMGPDSGLDKEALLSCGNFDAKRAVGLLFSAEKLPLSLTMKLLSPGLIERIQVPSLRGAEKSHGFIQVLASGERRQASRTSVPGHLQSNSAMTPIANNGYRCQRGDHSLRRISCTRIPRLRPSCRTTIQRSGYANLASSE